jgi:hypothetical protein
VYTIFGSHYFLVGTTLSTTASIHQTVVAGRLRLTLMVAVNKTLLFVLKLLREVELAHVKLKQIAMQPDGWRS